MKVGSIVSCLRKGQCLPLPAFRTVCFGVVEAYGNDCCAAGDYIEADPDPFVHSHSIVYEPDCVYEFAAIGNATLLHGQVLLDTFDESLKHSRRSGALHSTVVDRLHLVAAADPAGGNDDERYNFDAFDIGVRCSSDRQFQPHVIDRWCAVFGNQSALTKLPIPTLHIPDDYDEIPGAIEWLPPRIAVPERTGMLIEAINGGTELATVALCQRWGGPEIITVRSYGFFDVYAGIRDFEIPLDQVHLLRDRVRWAWNDQGGVYDISFTVVEPQPAESGIDLHIIAADSHVISEVVLIDLHYNGQDRRSVVNRLPVASGYAMLARAGFEIATMATYIALATMDVSTLDTKTSQEETANFGKSAEVTLLLVRMVMLSF